MGIGTGDVADPTKGLTRRTFLGFVLAAPTVMAGVQLGPRLLGDRADAAVPSPPQPAEVYDLTDMLTDAARPTSGLITVTVTEKGRATFALPRAEVGQG